MVLPSYHSWSNKSASSSIQKKLFFNPSTSKFSAFIRININFWLVMFWVKLLIRQFTKSKFLNRFYKYFGITNEYFAFKILEQKAENIIFSKCWKKKRFLRLTFPWIFPIFLPSMNVTLWDSHSWGSLFNFSDCISIIFQKMLSL